MFIVHCCRQTIFSSNLRSMPTTLTCWISPSFWIWSFLVPPSLCGGWTFNFFYKVSFEKHPNEGIYTGWFFHWYPQFQYQKENLQLANHSCCSTVNPVTKKGRDWLLGGFLVGTEIGGYQWKNHPVWTMYGLWIHICHKLGLLIYDTEWTYKYMQLPNMY